MQHWDVQTSKSGWFTASTGRFLTAELPRIFTMLNDPAGWPVEAPQRLIKTEPNVVLGYSFANQSRVEITFDAIRAGLVRVNVQHEHLHNADELSWAQHYWQMLLDNLYSRLLCEPVHAAIAFGKINLFFAVGPLQEDGYHQVASLYQSVNLRETVIAEWAPDWQVSTSGSLSKEQLAGVPTDKRNLVVKAARALAKTSKLKQAAKLQFWVHKHVPVAGGMGGGSADAAAAMLAAASAWGLTNYDASLIPVGTTVGADVPFALMGGAAIGMGTGHELTEIAQASKLHWVLVPNEFGLSTPKVFAELDRMRAAGGQDPAGVTQAQISAKLVTALEAGATAEEIAPLLHNDLQAAAVSLRPELEEILNLADKVFALRAIISGSGPTIAMLARDANDAIAIASRLRTYGQQAIVTSSPAGAAQLVL